MNLKKNFYDYPDQRLNFLTGTIFFILRVSIIIIHYLPYTPNYLQYIAYVSVAFFSQVTDSYAHFIGCYVVCYLILFTFFLFLLLNLPFTKKKVEIFLGEQFL